MRKFPDGKTRSLAFVNGFATLPGVKKVFPQATAMKLLDIKRPTYYKYVKQGRIKRVKVRLEKNGFTFERWGVPESEIERILALMAEGWVRGKSKMTKKKKK